MTGHKRHEDGSFHIDGHKYKGLCGSRVQVMNGTVHHTSGGLTKKHLKLNKWGRIVSALKSRTAKKQKHLEKAGYFAKKGEFGVVKKDVKSRKNRSRKH